MPARVRSLSVQATSEESVAKQTGQSDKGKEHDCDRGRKIGIRGVVKELHERTNAGRKHGESPLPLQLRAIFQALSLHA